MLRGARAAAHAGPLARAISRAAVRSESHLLRSLNKCVYRRTSVAVAAWHSRSQVAGAVPARDVSGPAARAGEDALAALLRAALLPRHARAPRRAAVRGHPAPVRAPAARGVQPAPRPAHHHTPLHPVQDEEQRAAPAQSKELYALFLTLHSYTFIILLRCVACSQSLNNLNFETLADLEPLVDALFDENVLLSSGWTCRDVVRCAFAAFFEVSSTRLNRSGADAVQAAGAERVGRPAVHTGGEAEPGAAAAHHLGVRLARARRHTRHHRAAHDDSHAVQHRRAGARAPRPHGAEHRAARLCISSLLCSLRIFLMAPSAHSVMSVRNTYAFPMQARDAILRIFQVVVI